MYVHKFISIMDRLTLKIATNNTVIRASSKASSMAPLRRLEKMHPIPGSLLARAFIQADLESPKVILLLEGLAAVARQQGWTCLSPSGLEQTDFQKQCAETIQDFLPSILVNQRHEMGPLLSLVLPHCDGFSPELGAGSPGPPAFPVGPGGAHSAR